MHRIPNILTIIRVLLIPVFIWLVFLSQSPHNVAWSLLVFVIAAFTDFLDGFLARKWNVISDFGKIADPLADKLLVLSALAALTWQARSPYELWVWIFVVIAIREVFITILREFHKKKGFIMPADKLGKFKTVLQMAGIIAAFALWAWYPDLAAELRLAANLWFAAVALLTLYSGLNYLMPGKITAGKE
ncbi:MAG: CDP-diacylglycerol--glycerol-3-phosphate 3-phosphatidyltransferase [Candidatus Syntrophosphaera sp.]